jgi:hypothetical protein
MGASGGDTVDLPSMHEAAATGISGAGSPLPHQAAIQASFGSHKVDSFRAHTGQGAAAANRALGSEAYASGGHIAFADEQPSLHTAAHEAAHIIQQQQGVSLPGGIGKEGDAYERAADQVADRVVQGRSAEDLLGPRAGGGGSGGAVQRLIVKTKGSGDQKHVLYEDFDSMYHAVKFCARFMAKVANKIPLEHAESLAKFTCNEYAGDDKPVVTASEAVQLAFPKWQQLTGAMDYTQAQVPKDAPSVKPKSADPKSVAALSQDLSGGAQSGQSMRSTPKGSSGGTGADSKGPPQVDDIGQVLKNLTGLRIEVPGRQTRKTPTPAPVPLDLGDQMAKYASRRAAKRGEADYRLELCEAVDQLRKNVDATQNPDLAAALHWAYEILYVPPRGGSAGGKGTLATAVEGDKVSASGRPAFDAKASGVGIRPGQHRRHIIAWHTIRGAIRNLCSRALKAGSKAKDVLITIFNDFNQRLPASDKDDDDAADSATGATASGDPKDVELAELLHFALTSLNSNVNNLWPGGGYENSLINTYQGVLKKWAEQIPHGADPAKVLEYKNQRAAELRKRCDDKGGQFKKSLETVVEILSTWTPMKPDNAAGELSGLLGAMADSFEVDPPLGDGERDKLRQDGHDIAISLISISGRFLEWAENPEQQESQTLDELAAELKALLDGFMFPKDAYVPMVRAAT